MYRPCSPSRPSRRCTTPRRTAYTRYPQDRWSTRVDSLRRGNKIDMLPVAEPGFAIGNANPEGEGGSIYYYHTRLWICSQSTTWILNHCSSLLATRSLLILVTCSRYASHWNAFLFSIIFVESCWKWKKWIRGEGEWQGRVAGYKFKHMSRYRRFTRQLTFLHPECN